MTNLQLKLIHIAAHQLKMSDTAYRVLLHNVAGVRSSKMLRNDQYEDVMAVLEAMGFRTTGRPDNYWREMVAKRSQFANSRMVRLIWELAGQTPYQATGMCRRMSHGRTDRPEELYPKEAYDVIEALKQIIQRAEEASTAEEQPSMFVEPATKEVPRAIERDLSDIPF